MGITSTAVLGRIPQAHKTMGVKIRGGSRSEEEEARSSYPSSVQSCSSTEAFHPNKHPLAGSRQEATSQYNQSFVAYLCLPRASLF